MNKTSIDWCDYTWNPVVGCKGGCHYCYARKLHNMRHKAYLEGKKLPVQYAKPFEEIQFFPERLSEPAKLKKPSTIFVCSTSDLFGFGVEYDWVYQVIERTYNLPRHKFMFLTKIECAYNGFYFPDNCMLGLTVTGVNSKEVTFDKIETFKYLGFGKKFISIEPLLGSFEDVNLNMIDQIIVGAETGKNAKVPPLEWVKSIKHPNILYKQNLKKIYPEL